MRRQQPPQPQPRQRREHTRSRDGCLVCRRRHVRCDEQRPVCKNCLLKDRPCRYEVVGVPLREKGSQRIELPGIQLPWQAEAAHSQALPCQGPDPLDCLPIEMPYQTRQVLRHLVYLFGYAPNKDLDSQINLAFMANRRPACFHVLLIMTSAHYSFHAGGLHTWQATYCFHMAGCFRAVNGWLARSRRRAPSRLLSLIASLCLAESYVGNVHAAEAHLKGLLSLVDGGDARDEPTDDESSENEKDSIVVQHYLTIAHNLISAIINLHAGESRRLRDTATEHARVARPHLTFLLSYFFSATAAGPGTAVRLVNPVACLATLRKVTTTVDDEGVAPGVAAYGLAVDYELQAVVLASAHREEDDACEGELDGLYEAGKPGPAAGFVAACGFYMYNLFGLWQRDRMADDSGLLRKMFAILQKDLQRSEPSIANGGMPSRLWLWKAFGAAMGLATMRDQEPREKKGANDSMSSLYEWFLDRLRRWSRASDVVDWGDAHKALSAVVWAEGFSSGSLAEEVWQEAMKQES